MQERNENRPRASGSIAAARLPAMKALDWHNFFAEQQAAHGKVVFSVAELANAARTTLHALNTERPASRTVATTGGPTAILPRAG